MNVSAIIVTRGDHDLRPIFDSLPQEWGWIVWDNGRRELTISEDGLVVKVVESVSDLSVYGRYAAIEYATGDLIVTQDDDCVVSDPQAIVDAWQEYRLTQFDYQRSEDGEQKVLTEWANEHVVCNMPPEFRHEFYEEHALVGFGACFHRDAPVRAFEKLNERDETRVMIFNGQQIRYSPLFTRTCDIVFTALTPRVLVDVPVKNLWWAEDETRMYRQYDHGEQRARMLELVKKVRDG